MIKKILLGTLTLVAIAAIALTAYLLPAHLQVRAINSPLPDAETLLALKRHTNKPTRVSAILTSSQSAPGRAIGHHTVVIEWGDGRLFLIDAGMDEANAIAFGELLETLWSADPAQFHTTAFAALGTQDAQVRGIGFTHLHIDHTQGIADKCAGEASFVVVQTEAQRKLHNMNTEEGAAIVATCPQSKPIAAEGLADVPGFPGLGVYTLGGHTPGSTLFAVALGERVLVFSGDITNTKIDLLEDRGKGFLYSYLIVPEDTGRTADLRAWLRALNERDEFSVYVSHDIHDMAELMPFATIEG